MKLVQRQTRRAFHHFRVQTKALPGADEAAFFEQFKGLADAFYTSALRETSLAKVYLDMMRSGYRAGYSFHASLRLHAKALTYCSNWPPRAFRAIAAAAAVSLALSMVISKSIAARTSATYVLRPFVMAVMNICGIAPFGIVALWSGGFSLQEAGSNVGRTIMISIAICVVVYLKWPHLSG